MKFMRANRPDLQSSSSKFVVEFFFFLRFSKKSTYFTENKFLENTQFNLGKKRTFPRKTKKRDVCTHSCTMVHTAVYTSGRSTVHVCVHTPLGVYTTQDLNLDLNLDLDLDRVYSCGSRYMYRSTSDLQLYCAH
jgi:hypothetical protein